MGSKAQENCVKMLNTHIEGLRLVVICQAPWTFSFFSGSECDASLGIDVRIGSMHSAFQIGMCFVKRE